MKSIHLLLALSLGLSAYAQQITAGPAIPATTTSAAWLAGKNYCPSASQATPVTAAVNTAQLSGVIPPQSVLQNELYSNLMTCTVTGLTAGASYQVTWIGAELYYSSAGQRVFSMSANGTSVFSSLDIFLASGGKDIAIQRSATIVATATGTIVMTLTNVTGGSKFDALIITPVVTPPPAPIVYKVNCLPVTIPNPPPPTLPLTCTGTLQ